MLYAFLESVLAEKLATVPGVGHEVRLAVETVRAKRVRGGGIRPPH